MAMFDQTFVDGEGKTHKGWTVVLSFAFQFLLTGILILASAGLYTFYREQQLRRLRIGRPQS